MKTNASFTLSFLKNILLLLKTFVFTPPHSFNSFTSYIFTSFTPYSFNSFTPTDCNRSTTNAMAPSPVTLQAVPKLSIAI